MCSLALQMQELLFVLGSRARSLLSSEGIGDPRFLVSFWKYLFWNEIGYDLMLTCGDAIYQG